MKSKLAWLALAAALLVVIAVTVLIVATVNKPLSESSGTSTEQTQVERTLSGKSAAEDKQDVLAAAVELLTLVDAPNDEAGFQERMMQIESGEASLPEGLSEKIRLVDSLTTEEGIDSTIHQALVTFGTFAKQSSGADEITPLYGNAAEGVILDQEAGVAYVPTTLFINSATGVNGFSMEFIYIDGEWIFSPYMTLDELRLAIVLQGSAPGTSE